MGSRNEFGARRLVALPGAASGMRFVNRSKISMIDMRTNLIACGVTLVVGLGLLRFLASTRYSPRSNSRLWVPLAALVAGPALGIFCWAIEVFAISPDYYITSQERLEELPAILSIGMFVGVVVAVAIALAIRPRSSGDG